MKWIQHAVERSPQLLQPDELPEIVWVSPLAEDDYAEYRDDAFLRRLGLEKLSGSLKAFWPQRGPQWDALGRTTSGPVLVEAKAHIREFFSKPTNAKPRSLDRIHSAFSAVQNDLGITPSSEWSKTYYQYANRLALLWWLREHGIDAKLLFVSFLNDEEMCGPRSSETWHAVFASADYALGLAGRNKLRKHILHVLPDVQELI